MAFAPLYNKISALESKIESMSGMTGMPGLVQESSQVDLNPIYSKLAYMEDRLSMVPPVTEPVDLNPIYSKMAEMEVKIDAPHPEYATAESMTSLVEKYNQITSVLTQFNMQLSAIMEKITVLESK
jgi:hypothetical protein